jgi:hypothetical protein
LIGCLKAFKEPPRQTAMTRTGCRDQQSDISKAVACQ